MSNLIKHAESELKLAGLFDEDSDYGGMLGDAVLDMVRVFSKEGHSGMSASLAVSIFKKVALFEPLTPLTGEDDEWTEITDGTFQNKRCSHVFKENGKAHDIDGIVFEEPDGSRYTGKGSRVDITFPYTPTTTIKKVPKT